MLLEEELVEDIGFEPDSINIGIKAEPTDVRSDPTAGIPKTTLLPASVANPTNEATQTEQTSRGTSVQRSVSEFQMLSVKKKPEKARKASKETAEKLVQTEPEEAPKRRQKQSKKDQNEPEEGAKPAVSGPSNASEEPKQRGRQRKNSKAQTDQLSKVIAKEEEKLPKEVEAEKPKFIKEVEAEKPKLPNEVEAEKPKTVKQTKQKAPKAQPPEHDSNAFIDLGIKKLRDREEHRKQVLEKLKVHLEKFKNEPQTDNLPKYEQMNFRSVVSKQTKESEAAKMRKSRTEHSRPPESLKKVKAAADSTSKSPVDNKKTHKNALVAEEKHAEKNVSSALSKERIMLREKRRKTENRPGFSETKEQSPEVRGGPALSDGHDRLLPNAPKIRSGNGKIPKPPKELGEGGNTERFNGVVSIKLKEDDDDALFR